MAIRFDEQKSRHFKCDQILAGNKVEFTNNNKDWLSK